ncbi:ChuX/HutX family heme-like substrate-binding protein [Cerasicoccus frondis]|uniref:ChuX/HutX family heme-like substrate-binding protein n=1 Tax=Cerasicoccus frondis TaxID=490090 RepID=UPI00285258BC|nr:ChuX/HutX family heme-like substrate-binding protein [Cerasicoccus frondis]
MHKNDPHSADSKEAMPKHAGGSPCQSELVHVCELYCAPEGILESASRVEPVLCFARNRHCILGYSGSLPVLQPQRGMLRGASSEASLVLHHDRWQYAFATHEQACDCGTLMGVEFFDEHRNAIFRVALTPDSDRLAMRDLTQTYHLRCLSPDEFGAYSRLAELQPIERAGHAAPADALVAADAWCAPFFAGNGCPVDYEMGFGGDDYLVSAVFAEVIEEKQDVMLSVVGGFGHICTPLRPHAMERIRDGWIFVGGEGRAMRLNTRSIAHYWIGLYRDQEQEFSYFEAVDVFGDLIFRLTSQNAQSYRYWQALARSY